MKPGEARRLARKLPEILPLLRPEAQRFLASKHFLTRRRCSGHRTVAVVNHYCVFYNEGCVLHKVGAAEGDKFRYKPVLCSLFPILLCTEGDWYVRQWGLDWEGWDLFCLHPEASNVPARESLKDEIAFANRLVREQPEWVRQRRP